MNKVVVLFAAYNGELTIAQQLDTILQQENVDVHVVCSVDLSSDTSLNICSDYVQRFNNVTILPYGEHFGGAGKNFYRLLKDTNLNDYDYISFSDQDDLWPSNKLSTAIDKLKNFDCYSSNVIAFWADGRNELIDKAQPQLDWDFLFEAAGPGCTYVVKRDVAVAFKALLMERYDKITNEIALHDWLIYAFARSRNYLWYIDSKPMMLYRQHANNQVGVNNSIASAKKRFHLIKNKWFRYQVTKIAEHIGLRETVIYRHGLSCGYKGNIWLLFNVNQLRRRHRDRLALAIALIFNFF